MTFTEEGLHQGIAKFIRMLQKNIPVLFACNKANVKDKNGTKRKNIGARSDWSMKHRSVGISSSTVGKEESLMADHAKAREWAEILSANPDGDATPKGTNLAAAYIELRKLANNAQELISEQCYWHTYAVALRAAIGEDDA